VHLANTVRLKQDALRRRRFTGVDVGHDPDISAPL
jgi:hypothetical protein